MDADPVKDPAPPPGHPVQYAPGRYMVSLGREPRRGSRRAKPLNLVFHGVVYVAWRGPVILLAPVWWDERDHVYSIRKPLRRGALMPGWRVIAEPVTGADGQLLAKVSF